MPQQAVVGPVQGTEAAGLEVAVEQVAEAAALAQPDVGGPFGSRAGHAPDQQGQRGLALRQRQAQFGQQGRQAELAGGPQGGVFDADRARSGQFQGSDVDALAIRCRGGRAVRRCRWRGIRQLDASMQQAVDDVLGFGLDGGRASDRQQDVLGVEQLADTQTEAAPVCFGDGKLRAEIEQGALADLGALALGLDEAEGGIVLAIARAGASAADEHTPREHGGGRKVNPCVNFMALHFESRRILSAESTR